MAETLFKIPEYQVWAGMLNRCENPRNQAYAAYGGRGITVCKRWHRFDLFLRDVGRRPDDKHEINRIDNNGNYEPGNVNWVTVKQNSRNRRSARMLTIDGKTICVAEWAEHFGVKYETMLSRAVRMAKGTYGKPNTGKFKKGNYPARWLSRG